VHYKLAIKKITNGLLSQLSNTMFLPPGQKTDPMFNHIIRLQDVIEIITNETVSALNLLAKQTKKCATPSIRTTWL
jgi:hypothetical protein